MNEATRTLGFGAEVKRRIMLGTYALSAGYYDAVLRQALKVRTADDQRLSPRLRTGRLLARRDGPSVAFKFGEKTSNPLAMYLSDVFTIPTTWRGTPRFLSLRSRRRWSAHWRATPRPGRSEAGLFAAARVLEVEQAS